MALVTINDSPEATLPGCSCAEIDVMPLEQSVGAAPTALSETSVAGSSEASYGQILKSSALIGGSSVVNIAMGIIRTKAMAMLLGPAGFGLFWLYGSIASLTQSIAGMGINSSGVRQIAEAVGSENKDRISQTATVLRKTSVVLGLLGTIFLSLFCRQISKLTFGNTDRSLAIALLSAAVFFTLVSAGQAALIQGMRRIADLAKMNVLGSLFGAIISIPMVYAFREKGVVPSLISVAALTLLTSWWYSRKIEVKKFKVKFSQVRQEASSLLKLGTAFMASGFMTMGVAYAVRVFLVRSVGFEATGLYQSAWTLGGLYVGFILQAMAADFYPRLTASINDSRACNRLVNEQARVGLLLAGPGVIATLTLAPLVMAVLYSTKFASAVPVLRWICLGTMLQVITWPMGFIIVAKGRQGIFFCCELAWTVVSLGLAWLGVRIFGLTGAGIAFCASYVFHALLIYPVVTRMSGFRWSIENKKTGSIFLTLIAAVFYGFYVFPPAMASSFGVAAAIFTMVYSIKAISTLTALPQIPRSVRNLLLAFRSVPPESKL
jgi:PST family polysaccharide transporter